MGHCGEIWDILPDLRDIASTLRDIAAKFGTFCQTCGTLLQLSGTSRLDPGTWCCHLWDGWSVSLGHLLLSRDIVLPFAGLSVSSLGHLLFSWDIVLPFAGLSVSLPGTFAGHGVAICGTVGQFAWDICWTWCCHLLDCWSVCLGLLL